MQYIEMIKNTIDKMIENGSFVIGTVAGIAISVPQWVLGEKWTLFHTLLLLFLIIIFVFEWLVGGRLAKKSSVKLKTSEVIIDSLIRDSMIIIFCAAMYGADRMLGTGSIIFTVFTLAFIYHNFYSLMGNMVVLKWDKHFPMWMLKWLDNEIVAKTKKYFPENSNKVKDGYIGDEESNYRDWSDQ